MQSLHYKKQNTFNHISEIQITINQGRLYQ